MVLIGMAWVRATTISVFWQKSGCLWILSKWAIKQQIYLNSIIHRWTVVSYPGCVGGERRLSPPTQPGYEAKVDRNTEIVKVDLPRLWISRVSSGSSGLWSLVRTQALRACCPGKWALGLLTAVRKTSQEKQPGSSVVVAISSVHAYILPKPQNTYVVKWRPRCVVLLKIKLLNMSLEWVIASQCIHHTPYSVYLKGHISCYSNIVVNCQPNSERKQWHSPKTAVESPTFATKMLSCLNITVETVVPAVLRSPILFLFHVPVKPMVHWCTPT